jgi:hypothetical protein
MRGKSDTCDGFCDLILFSQYVWSNFQTLVPRLFLDRKYIVNILQDAIDTQESEKRSVEG